jgi:ankyrin repeat protein
MHASILKKKNATLAKSGPPNWNDEQDSPVLKKGETMTLLEQNAKERYEAARLASYNASVSLPPVSLPRTGQHFALSRIYQPCSEAILYLQEIFELKAYSDLASSIETYDDGRVEFINEKVNSLKKTPAELKDDALDKSGMEFMLRFPQEYFERVCMNSMDRMMARLKGAKEISFVLDPLTRKVLERVLFRAFQIKDIEIVKRVLQWDINIDSSDLFGTPLMYAASWGNAEHVRLLLERGAFVSSSNLHGTTSAHKAAEYGFDEVLKELISFGADVNCKDVLSTRPLHCAVHGDHVDAAALLIAAGADINALDGAGFCSLHIAVAKKHLKSVCLLLQHPTLNLNLRSPSGRVALHFAAEIGEEFEHVYIMEKLLEQACDVNAQDKNKRTPLHSAMAMPHYKIAALLVKGGASVLVMDNKEKTAAELITLVPGENGLRKAIHEAKRRELAGEVFDKDAVSFGHEGEPGAPQAANTTRRPYKEIVESESRYIEMVKEQEEVLAAYKKDTAKLRLRFKERIHDALVKGGLDRPSSASTHSTNDSDGSREREIQAVDRKESDFVLQVMEGLVFCSNCEQQLPSVVNIPEKLRSSFYTFCPHCGHKGPCPDLVDALQSLKHQNVSLLNCFIIFCFD